MLYETNKYKVGVNALTHRKQLDCVRELLNTAGAISSFESVLDCPCGSGRFTELLVIYKLTCADSSRKRLKDANSLSSEADIEFRHCDIFKMPFDDSSFDLILTMLLLQHIKKAELPALLLELYRVTRTWLLISYSTKFSLSSAKRMFNPNANTLTKSEFSKLYNEAGFTIIKEVYTVPFVAATKVVLLQKK